MSADALGNGKRIRLGGPSGNHSFSEGREKLCCRLSLCDGYKEWNGVDFQQTEVVIVATSNECTDSESDNDGNV